jgi:hypothetical protein
MTPRLKSTLLLIVVLIIGGILGALVQARLAEQRIEQIAAHRSERGFMRFIERGIEPVDADQEGAVRTILRGSSMRVAEQTMRHRAEIRAIMDSTRAELSTVLTPEQMAQLEEHLDRHRPMRRGHEQRGHRRGPVGDR